MPKVHNKYHDTAPVDAVYIGRGSAYWNPFEIGKPHPHTDEPMTRDDVCDLFESEVLPLIDVSDLAGKDLVCFCKPKRCHGDSLLVAANTEQKQRLDDLPEDIPDVIDAIMLVFDTMQKYQ